MKRYVSSKLRQQVAERAHFCCEYCLSFEEHSFIKFQIEHIISMKHGGETQLDNLAYSCFYCNSNKGTDLGTILEPDQFVRFYNPRKDRWTKHFELSHHILVSKTAIGEATIKIFKINQEERLIERLALLEAEAFPHKNAVEYLK